MNNGVPVESGKWVVDLGVQGACSAYGQSCINTAVNKCASVAAQNANVKSAAWWCLQGVPNGSKIASFANVQTANAIQPWQIDAGGPPVGVLTNIPAVTKSVCTCPAGWAANMTNQVGGVTSDGKCKRGAGTNAITPAPPNGTPIGMGNPSWGFTWGNGFVAWGTTANGGAPTCATTQVSPAQCHF